MSDLISRQAAIDALARMMPRSYTPDGSHPADEEIFRAQEVIADCIEALEILPSAQPEPKRGKWIKMSDADGDYYCCDQCGEELPRYMTEIPSWDRPYPHKQSIDKTDFCPNCEADMRGEQDENR